jgi:hypothetical protein
MREFVYVFLMVVPDAVVRLSLNEMPLLEEPRAAGMGWMQIVDLHLLPQNILDLEVQAEGPVTATLRLRRYAEGMVVNPAEGIDLPLDLRQRSAAGWQPVAALPGGDVALRAETGPLVARGVFASPGPDHSAVYLSAPPAPGGAALALGRQILADFTAGRIGVVLDLSAPLIADIAGVWGLTAAEARAQYADLLRQMVDLGPTPFDPAWRVEAAALQQGRLIRITRDGGPLLTAGQGDRQASLEVVLGLYAGALRILR